MADGNGNGNVNIQINTQANTQGANQVVDSLKKVEGATSAVGEQAKQATEKGQKLNLAMEGLARVSPTAAAAVNMLKMAMNPMAAAIALGATAIYGLQRAWEAFYSTFDTTSISKVPGLFGNIEQKARDAATEAHQLAVKLNESDEAARKGLGSYQARIQELNEYTQAQKKVTEKRKEIDLKKVERDVASGKISPEEGARRKAGIETAFTKASGQAEEQAIQEEINLTNEAADKAKQERAAAEKALPTARAMRDEYEPVDRQYKTLDDRRAELKAAKAQQNELNNKYKGFVGYLKGVWSPLEMTEDANKQKVLNGFVPTLQGEVDTLEKETPGRIKERLAREENVQNLDKQATKAQSDEASNNAKLFSLIRQKSFVQEYNGLSNQAAAISAAGVTEGANRTEDGRALSIVRSAFNAAGGGGSKSQMVSMDEKMVSLLVAFLRPIVSANNTDRAQIQKIENTLQKVTFQLNAGRGQR